MTNDKIDRQVEAIFNSVAGTATEEDKAIMKEYAKDNERFEEAAEKMLKKLKEIDA